MSPLFCRHNRYMAECPICSKGTVFEAKRSAPRRSPAATPARGRKPKRPPPGVARAASGPYASAGPYEHDDGSAYEVRLERVPGGVRLASWSAGAIERRAPVLAADDLGALVRQAGERGVLAAEEAERLGAVLGPGPEGTGTSAGRSGELRDELRVEGVEEGRVRIGRWLHRPGTGMWELQEAPLILPAARFVEALAGAAR